MVIVFRFLITSLVSGFNLVYNQYTLFNMENTVRMIFFAASFNPISVLLREYIFLLDFYLLTLKNVLLQMGNYVFLLLLKLGIKSMYSYLDRIDLKI